MDGPTCSDRLTKSVRTVELNLEAEVICPHCGESFPLQIDTSQPDQTLVEDCTVCCRPMTLTVNCRPGQVVDIAISL